MNGRGRESSKAVAEDGHAHGGKILLLPLAGGDGEWLQLQTAQVAQGGAQVTPEILFGHRRVQTPYIADDQGAEHDLSVTGEQIDACGLFHLQCALERLAQIRRHTEADLGAAIGFEWQDRDLPFAHAFVGQQPAQLGVR